MATPRTLEAKILLQGRDDTGPAFASAARQARTLQKTMEGVARGMRVAGLALTAAVTLPVLAMAKASIDAFGREQAAAAGVKATLESMGPVAHRSFADLQRQTEGLDRTTTLTRTEIMQTQSVLLTFGHIHGRVYDRAIKAIADYTAHQKMIGQDVEPAEAARLWGRALQEPVRGMMALHRAGIFLSPVQERVIKQLLASGVAGAGAKAQMILLAELQKRFGGSMAKFMTTQVGQLEMAKKSWEELKVAIGATLAPTLLPLLHHIRTILDAFAKLPAPMKRMIVIGALIAATLGPVLFILGLSLSAFMKLGAGAWWVATKIVALARAAAGLSVLRGLAASSAFQMVEMKVAAQGAAGAVVELSSVGIWAALRAQVLALAGSIGTLTVAALPWIGVALAIAAVALTIRKFWEPLKAFFEGFFEGVASGLKPVSDALAPLAPIFHAIGAAVRWVWRAVVDLLTPLHLTRAQFDQAKGAGHAFGVVVGAALNLLLLPLRAITWPLRVVLRQFSDFTKLLAGWVALFRDSSGWKAFVASMTLLRDAISSIWSVVGSLVRAFDDLFASLDDNKGASKTIGTLRGTLDALKPVADGVAMALKPIAAYIRAIAWEARAAERAIGALVEAMKALRGKGDLSNIPRIITGQQPLPVRPPRPSPNVWDFRHWFDFSDGDRRANNLRDLVGRGESRRGARGGYDQVNLGQRGRYRAATADIERMTVAQIMAAQTRGAFRAAGKYQIMPDTLRLAVRALHLSGTEMFDRKMQDRIFDRFLVTTKRPDVGAYLTGKSNDVLRAAHALSLEFASFGDPRKGGRSHYPAPNRASVSVAETVAMLQKERAAYLARSTRRPAVPFPARVARALGQTFGIEAAKAAGRPRPSAAVHGAVADRRDREHREAALHRIDFGKPEMTVRIKPDGTVTRVEHKPSRNMKIKTSIDRTGALIGGGATGEW